MTRLNAEISDDLFQSVNPSGASSVVLVCEHAVHFIPDEFDNLGLPEHLRKSHAAWDPGAMAVGVHLSNILDATLIAGAVSRLVYDCNRPPSAVDAMPSRSETIDIPGNLNLSQSTRNARAKRYYDPFCRALSDRVAQANAPVIVTVHSFTPIYHGAQRDVEIGVLHDSDTRLADAMVQVVSDHTETDVQRNQPYGPEHGVTHTLKEHAIPNGHLNVMLEIRNDLIETEGQQLKMAEMIAAWLADAFVQTKAEGTVRCVV